MNALVEQIKDLELFQIEEDGERLESDPIKVLDDLGWRIAFSDYEDRACIYYTDLIDDLSYEDIPFEAQEREIQTIYVKDVDGFKNECLDFFNSITDVEFHWKQLLVG